ncbi:neuronal acetylcholine receptor subunit alpha-6-like [Apostichopus japonicus]|uniref:neuronal acetylcholine receptor subunit alpha-6-like n=1 Tax=Stichopus japonicus TaxID=307972 RepID=UPI003AB78D37
MFFFKCILLGIAFISQFCCLTGDCANISERTALHAKLLNSSTYNLYVRPVENSSLPVSVQFRFAPVILYLVQGNQELQLRGRMVLIWDDHRLTWNPDDYGGLHSLDLPVNKIWQPELILYERIPTDTDLNLQIETKVAKVLSNGTVYWYTMASTRSFCFMDIRKFPFDEQNCDVTFTTWMHPKSEQTLYHIYDLFINDTYKENEASVGEWKMTQFHYDPTYQCLYCVEDQSYITYKTTLERYNPLAAHLSLIVPCGLVTTLYYLMFWFPDGDAEVATYGLTCILALVAFLQLLYNLLPSTGVCFIGLYVVVLMTLGTAKTIRKVTSYCIKKTRSSISTDNPIAVAGIDRNDSDGGEGTQNVLQESSNDSRTVDAGSNLNDSDGRKGKQDGNPNTDEGASKKRKKIKAESKTSLLDGNTENKIREDCESCKCFLLGWYSSSLSILSR